MVAGTEQLPRRDALPLDTDHFCANKKVTASQDDGFAENLVFRDLFRHSATPTRFS